MQNLGFAFSLLPLVRHLGKGGQDVPALLIKHLQMFNTHPYLSGPILGSVVKLEEEGAADDGHRAEEAANLKGSLMGPYAALGDSFFWGSLRPFAAIAGVGLGLCGSALAPGAFLLLYSPAHFWIRCRGFIEGYRRGRQAVDFIRALELLTVARKIRWLSLVALGIVAAVAAQLACPVMAAPSSMVIKAVLLVLVILLFLAVKRGVSQVMLLYGMALLFLVLSFV
jgi:mannose PTS system EIID component